MKSVTRWEPHYRQKNDRFWEKVYNDFTRVDLNSIDIRTGSEAIDVFLMSIVTAIRDHAADIIPVWSRDDWLQTMGLLKMAPLPQLSEKLTAEIYCQRDVILAMRTLLLAAIPHWLTGDHASIIFLAPFFRHILSASINLSIRDKQD